MTARKNSFLFILPLALFSGHGVACELLLLPNPIDEESYVLSQVFFSVDRMVSHHVTS
jgi:hypothetical protein